MIETIIRFTFWLSHKSKTMDRFFTYSFKKKLKKRCNKVIKNIDLDTKDIFINN